MSDDLISRKALIEAMNNEIRLNHIKDVTIYIDVVELIRRLPPAFDKEKVKMEINENKDIDNLIDVDHAIYIIEKGGIE